MNSSLNVWLRSTRVRADAAPSLWLSVLWQTSERTQRAHAESARRERTQRAHGESARRECTERAHGESALRERIQRAHGESALWKAHLCEWNHMSWWTPLALDSLMRDQEHEPAAYPIKWESASKWCSSKRFMMGCSHRPLLIGWTAGGSDKVEHFSTFDVASVCRSAWSSTVSPAGMSPVGRAQVILASSLWLCRKRAESERHRLLRVEPVTRTSASSRGTDSGDKLREEQLSKLGTKRKSRFRCHSVPELFSRSQVVMIPSPNNLSKRWWKSLQKLDSAALVKRCQTKV